MQRLCSMCDWKYVKAAQSSTLILGWMQQKHGAGTGAASAAGYANQAFAQVVVDKWRASHLRSNNLSAAPSSSKPSMANTHVPYAADDPEKCQVLKSGIAEFYDQSSGLWEDIWGDRIHHVFYDPDYSSSSLSDFYDSVSTNDYLKLL